MANKKKAVLDRTRPFATVSSLNPNYGAYEQDGVLFGSDEVECGRVEGYVEKQEADAKKKKATDKVAKAKKVEELLGSFDDPNTEIAKENAAAAAAENLADA